ncbi:hypothetical protein GCM10027586_06740 [Kineococcus gypseus]
MKKRAPGGQGLVSSEIGHGAMGTSTAYGSSDQPDPSRAIAAAREAEATHYDTAELYGWGEDERIASTTTTSWSRTRRDAVEGCGGGAGRAAADVFGVRARSVGLALLPARVDEQHVSQGSRLDRGRTPLGGRCPARARLHGRRRCRPVPGVALAAVPAAHRAPRSRHRLTPAHQRPA